MDDHNGAAGTAIVLDAAADGDLPARLGQALASQPPHDVIIDLRGVAVADPALLRSLGAAAAAARAADRWILLAGASPEVYKALHVAGLAASFRRV